MKKTIISLMILTMFLTACSSQSNNNTKPDENKTDVTENNKGQEEVTPGTENKEESVNDEKVINEVKEYILSGQGDKPEAMKFKWSKAFLDKVDIASLYKDYISAGNKKDDVEAFAEYITFNAPISNNWEEMFKKDVKDCYEQDIVSIKHLEGELYQGYIMIRGVETAYLVVSARTGYFHGTSEVDPSKIMAKVQLYEGSYGDKRRFIVENRPSTYCEVDISNITDYTFDFTIYQIDRNIEKGTWEKNVIFLTNTAVFIEDGTKAAYYGKKYNLFFTFPDYHGAAPDVTDIEITGFEQVEGNTYVNNRVPGHEFN